MAAILPFLEEEHEIEAAQEGDFQVSGFAGPPAGMKVKKGPDFAEDGEWIVTYAGKTFRLYSDPTSNRIWTFARPPGVPSRHHGDGQIAWGKDEALQKVKAGVDEGDPTMLRFAWPASAGEKAKALAKLKRLLDRAEAHPEEEIDGVAIQSYFQNEVDLYREQYHEDPYLGALGDAEEYVGEVNHEIQIVEGDRLPKDDEGLEDLGDAEGDEEDDSDVVVAKGASQAEILQQQVEVNHVNLTRFVWNRSLVEEHLRSAKYWIETIGPKKAANEFVFKIDPPMPKDVRPWKLIGSHDGVTFRFFGDGNAKMACPTWDLPSGPPVTGGTCPGAAAAQTVVPVGQREQHLAKDDEGRLIKPHRLKVLAPGGEAVPFREAYTICSACYAGEGNFDYGEIQGATLLRYWWTKEMLRTPEGTREWIEIMASAILAMEIAPAADCYTDSVIRPVRIHSSGDFFSPAYAEAWMHVANAVGDVDDTILFWCPTRTWAAPTSKHEGSAFDWPKILSILQRPNLVVRPSAYHVGDNAPEGLTEPGENGYARGTTALVGPVDGKPKVFQAAFPDAIWRGEDDDRRDYDCPVYALKKAGSKGSCAAAGCRVCWTRPDLRVNYALH